MNIKLIFSAFVILVLAAMSVTALDNFTVLPATVELEDEADSTKTVSLTLTNTGDESLDAFSYTVLGETADDDADPLTVTLSTPTLPLANGSSTTSTLTAVLDEDLDVGEYSLTLNVTMDGVSNQVSLTVTVTPEVCKSGVEGDLELTLDEPDSGETFKPGEDLEIQVTVENNDDEDLDVKVVAFLYNVNEQDEEKKVSSEVVEVEEDDEEDFELTLQLPTNLDENDDYVLYVKAYEDGHESSNCNYESAEIQVERESHDVVVQEVKLLPDTVTCGEKVTAHVTVENIGTEDEDDVYVEFLAKDFSAKQESGEFDLEEYDDSDSDYLAQFTFDVPKTTKAGEYFVEALVHYNDGDSDSVMQKLVVTCDEEETQETVTGEGLLTVVNNNLKLDASQKKFVLELVLKNSGEKPVQLNLDVTEAQWADVLNVESPAVLNPGDEFHAYAYLSLKEGTQPGTHNLRVNLRKETGLLESDLVSVNVPEQSSVVQVTGAAVATPKWRSWFTEKPRLFWVLADLVLVALAVLFVRLLFKK